MNTLFMKSYFLITVWVFLSAFLTPAASRAQDSVIEALKRQMGEMQATMKQMAERIEQMEKERAAANTKLSTVEQSVKTIQSAPSALNPAIGMAIDTTAEHRGKAGGNFNFRSAEIGIAASIDPYARGYAYFNGGKSGVEVEEAAIVTTSLPWNLQARGGRFFADFGRLPKFHEHELPFVNFPRSVERMVGGESKADGAELSYLFPTPFFLRATVGGYNKIGAENERVDDSKYRSWSRFTYLGRLNTYFDITDDHSLEFGSSVAYTPSLRIADVISGGPRTLMGLDATYRFQPLDSTLYQGITVGGELFRNSERLMRTSGYERNPSYGGYTYIEGKLNRQWSTGFLFDTAPNIASAGKRTKEYAPFVTWALSEFNRLRFQYSYLQDQLREDKADRGHQFFLQWTTALGSHSHGFRTR